MAQPARSQATPLPRRRGAHPANAAAAPPPDTTRKKADMEENTGPKQGILLLDDERLRLGGLGACLRGRGHHVAELRNPEVISEISKLGQNQVVITHDRFCEQDALSLVDRVHRESPSSPVVLITSAWSGCLARQVAVRPFLWLRSEPVDPNELEVLVSSLLETRKPPLRRESTLGISTTGGRRRRDAPTMSEPTTGEPGTTDLTIEDCLALLAHELRSPLQSLTGWLEVLKMTAGESDRAQRAIAAMERSIGIQADLLNQIGMIEELARGQLEIEQRRHDGVNLVRQLIETFSPEARQRMELVVERSDTPRSILTDAARLGQAVRNVIENALKFSPPEGRVRVVVGGDDSALEITVSDEGPGFAPEVGKHIFDRFFQARTGARKQGLGLGLYIVRQIIEAHQGRVSAESDGPGKGARFRIRLPLAAAEAIPRERRARG